MHELIVLDAIAAMKKVANLEIAQIQRDGGIDGDGENSACKSEKGIADKDCDRGDGGSGAKLGAEQTLFQENSLKHVRDDDEGEQIKRVGGVDQKHQGEAEKRSDDRTDEGDESREKENEHDDAAEGNTNQKTEEIGCGGEHGGEQKAREEKLHNAAVKGTEEPRRV